MKKSFSSDQNISKNFNCGTQVSGSHFLLKENIITIGVKYLDEVQNPSQGSKAWWRPLNFKSREYEAGSVSSSLFILSLYWVFLHWWLLSHYYPNQTSFHYHIPYPIFIAAWNIVLKGPGIFTKHNRTLITMQINSQSSLRSCFLLYDFFSRRADFPSPGWRWLASCIPLETSYSIK